jgi:hypothetical protein
MLPANVQKSRGGVGQTYSLLSGSAGSAPAVMASLEVSEKKKIRYYKHDGQILRLNSK